jgi:hypothetical protein
LEVVIMQTVTHKIYGVGEVINKETTENGTYITVRFESGKEVRFSIPDSFTLGVMVANGALKDEVEAAISEKRARKQARWEELKAASTEVATVAPSRRHGRRPQVSPPVKGTVQTDYESYLISAGYKTETPSGHDSTVYAYSKAISNHVLKNEHMTWDGLRSNVDSVIAKYDVGGSLAHIGARSNNTVIDALKRFQEFVNP